MKLLVWNILFFYFAIAKASEGNQEDPLSEEVSSVGGQVKPTAASELTRRHLTDILEIIMQYNSQSLTTDPPAAPSIATTEKPEVLVTTEPSYMKINGTLMTDVIAPIIRDIVEDRVALENITKLVRVTVEALAPAVTEAFIASTESYVPGKNNVIKISRPVVETAIEKLSEESIPLLRNIVRSRLEYVLLLLSYNTKVLFKSVYGMKHGGNLGFGELWDKSWGLYKKYRDLYSNSTADVIYTYTPIEMYSDMESLFYAFSKDVREQWRSNFEMFQNVSGIDIGAVSDMILDIPGVKGVYSVIPLAFYTHVFFSFF